ncbi:MAG TPA: DUF190 domain-containing protein [Vulgatibacter sp.]
MRVFDGEQVLVRIAIGEGDRYRHQPLARALLERLKDEGFPGATVLRGMAGYGSRSRLHTQDIVDLTADLPIVFEVVDDEAAAERLLRILDEMLEDAAVVTLEKVRAVRYARSRPSA